MEKYKGDNFLCFTFPMSNFLIAGNVGYASSAAKLSASPPRPPSAAPNTAATIDRSKEQDGSEIRIVNSGTYPVVFSKADPTFPTAGGRQVVARRIGDVSLQWRYR